MKEEAKRDKILQMFFSKERWEYAIEKGYAKDIDKGQLYQLTKPETRMMICSAIKKGVYRISPPHTALIPKDTPGEFRTVYVNEPIDRVVLSIANDLLFELTPEMVHPCCKSYLKGVGCGSVVKEVSKKICSYNKECIGWKSDLSKYFDSVPIKYIDSAFDAVERKHGKSSLISVLREYYHSDWFFDTEKNLVESYQSLKQGCSVASWLADVLLYHIDDKLSKLNGYYIRYSDDMIFIGEDYMEAMNILAEELGDMQMKLNPKKVEYLSKDRWFRFLGFSIMGSNITFSKDSVKGIVNEIKSRTIGKLKSKTMNGQSFTMKQAVNSVNRYLYYGNGEFSWGAYMLPVVNVKHDVDELNNFIMDSIRAVGTKKTKIGGLGYVRDNPNGCIVRGLGRNVKSNRLKTDENIDGYLSLWCMKKAITMSHSLYETLVRTLV